MTEKDWIEEDVESIEPVGPLEEGKKIFLETIAPWHWDELN